MRVLHVIPSLSITSGGPSLALPAMAKALHKEGVSVDVATTDDDGRGLRKANIPLGAAVEGVDFRTFYFAKQTEFYKASLPLRSWLVDHVSRYDIVHIHALFSFASIAAARAARAQGVPYIVRPLGLLNAYGMQQRRRLVKHWSFRLVEKPLLDHATAIHYTSSQEQNEAENLKIKAPAVVIPLGIDLSPFQALPNADIFHQRFSETRDKQLILFLSRLDPKKGLELLLEAFEAVRAKNPQAHLVIVGDGPDEYVKTLRDLATSLSIADPITWTGRLEGTMKMSALAAATVFVLPSRSENFGIALLEAMAAGLPCISTEGVALAKDAGDVVLRTKPDPRSLSNLLERLLTSREERRELGSRAADFARENYSLDVLGRRLKDLYLGIVRDHPSSEQQADGTGGLAA